MPERWWEATDGSERIREDVLRRLERRSDIYGYQFTWEGEDALTVRWNAHCTNTYRPAAETVS